MCGLLTQLHKAPGMNLHHSYLFLQGGWDEMWLGVSSQSHLSWLFRPFFMSNSFVWWGKMREMRMKMQKQTFVVQQHVLISFHAESLSAIRKSPALNPDSFHPSLDGALGTTTPDTDGSGVNLARWFLSQCLIPDTIRFTKNSPRTKTYAYLHRSKPHYSQ